MTDTEGPELIEMPPSTLTSLDDLTDEARTMYEADDSGGYSLKPAARIAIEETNDELQQIWQTYQTGIAERDAKLASLTEAIRSHTTKNAIDAALVAAGVKQNLFRAAEAVLLDHLDIGVTQNDDGTVTTTASGPFGPCTVEQAVASWLDSDEGQPFAPKPATHEAGPFASAVRRLKTKMH